MQPRTSLRNSQLEALNPPYASTTLFHQISPTFQGFLLNGQWPSHAAGRFLSWAKRWSSRCWDEAEAKELKNELLRGGIGVGDSGAEYVRYSFCEGRWVVHYEIWHCRRREICRSKEYRHCIRSKTCITGQAIPCEGCGGISAKEMLQINTAR